MCPGSSRPEIAKPERRRPLALGGGRHLCERQGPRAEADLTTAVRTLLRAVSFPSSSFQVSAFFLIESGRSLSMFFENYHLNPKILPEQSLIFWKVWLGMGAGEGKGGPASTVRQIQCIRNSRTPGPKRLGRQGVPGLGPQASVLEPAVFLIRCLAGFTEDKLFQNNSSAVAVWGVPALARVTQAHSGISLI